MRKQAPFLDRIPRAPILVLTAVYICALPLAAQPVKAGTLRPTAIADESWLTHLQRSFDETSMGKTGRLGPHGLTTGGAAELRNENGAAEDGTVVLHGSDLYRMNCRGCHGEDGSGVPPEINSVINPVRATSAATVMERMRSAGMRITRADATKLAQQSDAMLIERLHHGGQDMPAFQHLSQGEVNSLVAYLRQLAGVRGAEREQQAVREGRVRVGEHIAKSTCHVCHSAAGPNPTPQQLYDGTIPPLSTLAIRTTRAEFVRKVTGGAPVMMGSTPELLRGRMPVFYYLTEEEAADIYLYLTRYPPNQWAGVDAATISTHSEEDAIAMSPARLVTAEPSQGVNHVRGRAQTARTDALMASFPMAAASLVALLLGLGLAFTVYEVRRLSKNGKENITSGDTDVEDANLEDGPRELDSEMVA